MTVMLSCRPSVLATVIAAGLMLATGVTYRLLATRLQAPLSTTPIAPDALEGFPSEIGGWVGQDVALDETILLRTDADAHINRRYSRDGGLAAISLYVACSVNTFEFMVHRPERCYTAAGWTLVDRRSVELSVTAETKLPCDIMQFVRGGVDAERVTVLHYFLVDGQCCGNISLLRAKVSHALALMRYAAQVQITVLSTGTLSNDSATKMVSAFAVDSAPAVIGLFSNLETSRACDRLQGELTQN